MAGRGPRNSNVRPFRQPGGGSNGWGIKLFAVVFYFFLGVILSQVTGNTIGLIMILGLLYWVFIHRRMQRGHYFARNRVLLIMLGVLFLLMFPLQSLAILLLAGLYWLLVARPHGEAPYFLRFHLLNGLIYYLFLVLAFSLVHSVIEFAFAMLNFVEPNKALAMHALYQTGFINFAFFVFVGSAAYFAVMALMGRTPYLGYVTDNVRHWA